MDNDNVFLTEWLNRLEIFGVKQADFEEHRNRLSEKFGKKANARDTIWSILNFLVMKYGSDFDKLENVYQEMAEFVLREGRDPSQLLRTAENIKSRLPIKNDISPSQVILGSGSDRYFKATLGADVLKQISKLRKEGKFEKATKILLEAEPMVDKTL